ncbi:reverse transcriptase domain-containing protein [Tanacetum coccineum]
MMTYIYFESKCNCLEEAQKKAWNGTTPKRPLLSPRIFNKTPRKPIFLPRLDRGRRDVCSIDWEEKNQARIHALIVTTRVPKQREPRYRQDSIIMRAHRPEEPTDIQRAKTAKGVTGSPNKKGIDYDVRGSATVPYKAFRFAAKTERWAMPMWCHMFNSTLTRNARVWFDKLPKESIDSYEDLRAAFRENYRQQTKHIKDPVEIHHIKERDGESTEDFMERYKEEVLNVDGGSNAWTITDSCMG